MNKSELIDSVANRTGLTKKDVATALDGIVGSVSDALKAGDNVQLVGFGTFKVSKRAARTGRNPMNGKEIKIAARKAPTFTAGAGLKKHVA